MTITRVRLTDYTGRGAERVAAVDKIEDQRKPEDFIGHRNRKTGRRSHPRPRQRPLYGLRHFHRKHAGRCCIMDGEIRPFSC